MPKICEYENCWNRASYGLTSNPIRCKEHKENMKLSSNLCKCGSTRPFYNLKGLVARFCSKCKTPEMINTKTRKCNCGKHAPCFNFPGLRPDYCNECKEQDMINLIIDKCECNTSFPIFNLSGLKARFCGLCKTPEMIDVRNKKCACGNRPSYNYEGMSAKCCTKCKLEGMIDVVHKKCSCNSAIPVYNYEGKKAKYCSKCKEPDMINVVDGKCVCGIHIAYYNYENLQPLFCSNCKAKDMIKVTFTKKCFCKKSLPTFNFKGLTAEYCNSCKSEDMIDVKHKRCKADNCPIRGNRTYKDYCTNCFQNLFPLDPLTFQISSKTKEIAVRDFINSKFKGFHHDIPLWYNGKECDCTVKRRIDHRKLIGNTLLCIETDENQHKSYSKEDEIARYNDLYMAHSGKFIFIRFNPDKYKDETGKSCNPMISKRLFSLQNEINKQILRINNEENEDLVEIVYMYYDAAISTITPFESLLQVPAAPHLGQALPGDSEISLI